MAKFRMLHERLQQEGFGDPRHWHQPLPAPRRWMERVHGRPYLEAFAQGRLDAAAQRRIGLPATTALVQRTWLAVGGTVLTARLALQHGLACHLAGGTHHAFPDYGSGFCIVNDVAVAARVLLAEKAVRIMNERKITCLFVVDPEGSQTAIGLLHIHDCLRAGLA